MSEEQTSKLKVTAVWLMRVLSGLTFMVSGWAKAVDPYGFFYKIGEYLSIWGIGHVIPVEIVIAGGFSLAIFEFITGTLLALGCMRRFAPLCAIAFMCFMLPLTLYIAIANPVADCGCFGEMIKMSNTATFIKNLVLTSMLIPVLLWHKKAGNVIRPGFQWLVIALAGFYSLGLTIIGWYMQPVVDFRPYPIGSSLQHDNYNNSPTFIYSKDGATQSFELDNLPDSTWTFVERIENEHIAEGLTIFDGDDDVTEEILSATEDDILILSVIDAGIDYLTSARFANEFADFAAQNGIRMIALVAAHDEALESWKFLARPAFEVYSVDNTSLKQLARGKTALTYIHDGKIVWKRNLPYIDPDVLSKEKPLEAVKAFDNGRVATGTSAIFAVCMLLLWLFDAFLFKPNDTVNVNEQQ